MSNKIFLLALSTMLFALCFSAEAQQPAKVPRVGIVTLQPLSAIADRDEAFRQGLRELGYLVGKTIVIEHRSAEGKFDKMPALVAELVRLKIDVILSHGPTTTRAAKEVTSTIPIVMAQDSDPVGNGFVASLARPGGNITGLSSLTSDLNGWSCSKKSCLSSPALRSSEPQPTKATNNRKKRLRSLLRRWG